MKRETTDWKQLQKLRLPPGLMIGILITFVRTVLEGHKM